MLPLKKSIHRTSTKGVLHVASLIYLVSHGSWADHVRHFSARSPLHPSIPPLRLACGGVVRPSAFGNPQGQTRHVWRGRASARGPARGAARGAARSGFGSKEHRF